MATVSTSMTMQEFLALPDDGIERWLIAGELREAGMTTRNPFHSEVMAATTSELVIWNRRRPEPRGKVLAGDAGVRLSRNPDTVFGIDIVYVSPELLAQQNAGSTIIDGVPTLAIEILSPSDVQRDIEEKIDALLNAGAFVWLINPRRKTVLVHQPGAEPKLFSEEISGEPYLPGFRVPVQRLFE